MSYGNFRERKKKSESVRPVITGNYDQLSTGSSKNSHQATHQNHQQPACAVLGWKSKKFSTKHQERFAPLRPFSAHPHFFHDQRYRVQARPALSIPGGSKACRSPFPLPEIAGFC
ncbi:MAG: hypothetical protein GY903_24485 [Fuerstiella sp.]|nr:hypothetical protein [Fuerstiella sp.]MCP4857654.1 hypothetical protein [Fuerstiella sp.]